MSPSEASLLARLQRRAATLEPAAKRQLFKAYEIIRSMLSESELLRAINSGQVEGLIDRLLNDKALNDAFAPLRELIDRSALESSRLWTNDLPSKLGGVFDILNPRVLTAVRDLDTRVIQGLKDDVREGIREVAREGLEAGTGPRTVARRMRNSIGLGPSQEQQVENFRAALRGERDINAYTLRNRRLDRMLAKGPLTEEQINRYTEEYRKRRINLNAETTARTIALDTNKLAQRMSWQAAIDRGTVDASRLRRIWITAGDDRVRPTHVAMNGQVVLWGQRWSNGQDIPGDTEYNCRCLERIVLVPVGQAPPVSKPPIPVVPPVVIPTPAIPPPVVISSAFQEQAAAATAGVTGKVQRALAEEAAAVALRAGDRLPSFVTHKLNSKTIAMYGPSNDKIWIRSRLSAAQLDEQVASGFWAQRNPVLHELGHKWHSDKVGDRFDNFANWRFSDEQRESIRSEVSRYAAVNGKEFVAEVYAGTRSGKVYGETIRGILRAMGLDI